MTRLAAAISLALMVIAGCAPQPSADRPAGAAAPTFSGPKRLTAAVKSEPPHLIERINPASIGYAGAGEMDELVSVGFVVFDGIGGLEPRVAQAVPSVENGLWTLLPDGRMETTWTIRDNARWHDGTPVTADDFAFTARVEQDKDVPVRRVLVWDYVEQVRAVDARTVVATWKQPFIGADQLFDVPPLPRHLLEDAYLADKSTFGQQAYFTHEFVGTGAFKVRDWIEGSQVVLAANDDYVLGRPKIDELVVKFIADSTTLAANLLAGAVELTIGRNLSLDQALQIRDQWRTGRPEIGYKNWILIYPEFMNPSPRVVADLRFRRALMHALDREEMATTLMAGLTKAAHIIMNPGQPEYADLEASVPHYDYDVRRAAQLIEELGYTKGGDGLYHGPGTEPLSVEIRTSGGDDLQEKSMFSAADYWQRIGVSVDAIAVPPQRSLDREYRNTFPAFDVKRQPNDIDAFPRMHSSQTPLPENGYVGSNFSRYQNPEFDRLIETYLVTIPKDQRIQVAYAIARHVAENLVVMGLFYQAEPTMVANRVQNVQVEKVGGSTHMGNAYEWDVTSPGT
jgi:peptide/nickel transport system substrate-binding protein